MNEIKYNGRQAGMPAMGPFPAVPDLDLYTIYPAGTTFAVPAGSHAETVQSAAAETFRKWEESAQ